MFFHRSSLFSKAARLTLLVVLCAVGLTVTGCGNGDPLTGWLKLTGVWKAANAGSDKYQVTSSSLSYDDGSNGEWGMSYSGNIRYVNELSDNSGVIIIKYTQKPRDSIYAVVSGDFIGIYYRNLTDNTVELSTAVDKSKNPYNTETETLDAAKAKFTKEAVSELAGYWSPMTKQ